MRSGSQLEHRPQLTCKGDCIAPELAANKFIPEAAAAAEFRVEAAAVDFAVADLQAVVDLAAVDSPGAVDLAAARVSASAPPAAPPVRPSEPQSELVAGSLPAAAREQARVPDPAVGQEVWSRPPDRVLRVHRCPRR